MVLYQGGRIPVGAVYQVTRRALPILQTAFPDETFQDHPARLSPFNLIHDLTLTDMMTELAKRNPRCRFVHGRLLNNAGHDRRRSPDAVMELPGDGCRIAVELELTAKSERRYRSIVFQYRSDPGYQKVLYVVAGKAIEAKIRRVIAGRRPVPLTLVGDALLRRFVYRLRS